MKKILNYLLILIMPCIVFVLLFFKVCRESQTSQRIYFVKSRHSRTATERYKEFLSDNPDLIQRLQLGYIASYHGITQVSLSRIRAEIK